MIAMVLLLQVLAAIAIVAGVAILLTGRGEPLGEAPPDMADPGLPAGRPMTPEDVIKLRFALAFRGYRMAEVDDALDRLAAELAARDVAIERLRAALGQPGEATTLDAPVEAVAAGSAYGAPALSRPFTVPAPAPAPAPPEPVEPEPVVPEPVLREPVERAAPPPEPAAPSPVTVPPATRALEEGEPSQVVTDPLAGADETTEPTDVAQPGYDPWAIRPQSRYTQPPTWLDVDESEEHDVERITEHHAGHAPPPAPGTPPPAAQTLAGETPPVAPAPEPLAWNRNEQPPAPTQPGESSEEVGTGNDQDEPDQAEAARDEPDQAEAARDEDQPGQGPTGS